MHTSFSFIVIAAIQRPCGRQMSMYSSFCARAQGLVECALEASSRTPQLYVESRADLLAVQGKSSLSS
jgi:hypothetical protein